MKDPLDVARGIVAASSPKGLHPNPERLQEARQDLALVKIERFIARALAEAPPLTSERRARLARLLTVDGGQR